MALAQPEHTAPQCSPALLAMFETEDQFVTVSQAKAYLSRLVRENKAKPEDEQRDLEGEKSPMVEFKGICFHQEQASPDNGIWLYVVKSSTKEITPGNAFDFSEARGVSLDGRLVMKEGKVHNESAVLLDGIQARSSRLYCKRVVAQATLRKSDKSDEWLVGWIVVCANLMTFQRLCKIEGWSKLP